MARKNKEIVDVREAGENHRVVTISGEHAGHCKKPCPTCPWRKDAVGIFPAQAFRHSAPTAYDAAPTLFACHTSGVAQGKICAGFLLRNALNNLAYRIGFAKGRFRNVSDGGHELFDSYREMAIANGVDPNDPVLTACRSNSD